MVLLAAVLIALAAPPQTVSPAAVAPLADAVDVPAGTTLPLVNTRPVWAKSAKAGDPLYLQTMAAALAGTHVVIPGGTYVLANITDVLKPTLIGRQALFTVQFRQMILPDGTTLPFPANTFARVSIRATSDNDLLLDNGTQLTMTTVGDMSVPHAALTRAIALAHPPVFGSFHTATACRNSPGDPGQIGSPGTPDTVIPGTPGTPDTVISNADGSTTTIPGIPATPSTTIPGTPSTPDIPSTPAVVCPDPPTVLDSVPESSPAPLSYDLMSSPVKKKKHKKSQTPASSG